jgi:hypothetical protein
MEGGVDKFSVVWSRAWAVIGGLDMSQRDKQLEIIK